MPSPSLAPSALPPLVEVRPTMMHGHHEAISSCSNGGAIVFTAGSIYCLNSMLDLAGCSNCDIHIDGLLKFSGSTDYWGGKTAMININKINGLGVSIFINVFVGSPPSRVPTSSIKASEGLLDMGYSLPIAEV
jgi:hypothetical protein